MELKDVVIVQVTSGKNQSVDRIRIQLFTNFQDAQRYCDHINSELEENQKHWAYAEIVNDGVVNDLLAPCNF